MRDAGSSDVVNTTSAGKVPKKSPADEGGATLGGSTVSYALPGFWREVVKGFLNRLRLASDCRSVWLPDHS